MKKITLNVGLSFLVIFILLGSCTTEGVNGEILTSETESLKTSKGGCSTILDFSDLDVETSWVSGNKYDREQYAACGLDNEEWMDKYTDGRFMLKCLKEDGQRTELKEATGDEANLSDYKRMRFTAKFSNIPSHGVTIAQIHNRADGVKRPWLRLYLDGDKTFKIKETETNPTGSSSTYTTYAGMEYSVNEEVEITIWTGLSGQEKAKIRVDYNGTRFQETLYPSSAWSNFENDYYLKAGVYTEGADIEAKVIYSAFSIVH